MSSIPANQLVNVNPSVVAAGGGALDLITLVLTKNTRVPIGAVPSFSSAAAVGAFFGLSSSEYSVAGVYFQGFDNSTKKPGALLFTQYPASAVAAYLQGGNISALTLAALQALSGTLTIVFDGYTRVASSINLSGATSFSSAASLIQTGLNSALPQEGSFTGVISGTTLTVSALTGTLGAGQTVTGTGVTAATVILSQLTGSVGGTGTYLVNQSQTALSAPMLATATPVAVTYDSVSGAFIITSGATGAASTAAFATGSLSASLLLTSATGAVLSQGAAAATPAAFMTSVANLTTNWATFMTAFNPDSAPGVNTNKLAFALWTSQQNNRYAYIAWDTDAAPTVTLPATGSLGYALQQANYSGTIPVWEPSDTNLAAFVGGAIASIDFSQTNGRTTLAGKGQTGFLPTVSDATTADNLAGNPQSSSFGNGYNFYGVYGAANQTFQEFQRGTISGPFQWIDSYVNQIWLNAQFQLAALLFMQQSKSVPYNPAGYAALEGMLATPIQAGLNFGAYSAGVTLSGAQIAEVNAAAGLKIDTILQTRGWFLQVSDPGPQARSNRQTPIINFWYVDSGSVQSITMASIAVQ